MAPRSELKTLLESLVGSGKVYFQPPASFQMAYPCIVYELSNANTIFADNAPYAFKWRYSLTVMAKDPDSDIPGKVAMLPECVYDRHFTKDNLNHDVFSIYF